MKLLEQIYIYIVLILLILMVIVACFQQTEINRRRKIAENARIKMVNFADEYKACLNGKTYR
jgi:hypothetical protein